jgi:hypothetical protein
MYYFYERGKITCSNTDQRRICFEEEKKKVEMDETSHPEDRNVPHALTDKLLACFETRHISDHQLDVLLNDIIKGPEAEAGEPRTNARAENSVPATPFSSTRLDDRYQRKGKAVAKGKHARSSSDSSSNLTAALPFIAGITELPVQNPQARHRSNVKRTEHLVAEAKPPRSGQFCKKPTALVTHGYARDAEERTLDQIVEDALAQKRQVRCEEKMSESSKAPRTANATSKSVDQTTKVSSETIMASFGGKEDDLLNSLGLSFDGGTIVNKTDVIRSLQGQTTRMSDVEYGPVPARYEACQVLKKYIENGYSFPDTEKLLETAPVEEPTDTSIASADSRERHECHAKSLLAVVDSADKEGGACNQLRKQPLLVSLLVVLILVVLIVGFPLALRCVINKGCSEETQSSAITLDVNATEAPSASSSLSPSFSPRGHVLDVFPPYTLDALEDASSPQSQAYAWVQNDPLLHTYSNARLLQRFALATLYYATGSSGWKETLNWLAYEHDECTWYSKTDPKGYSHYNGYPCNQEQQYKHLTLYDNGLAGSIPPEVSLLT